MGYLEKVFLGTLLLFALLILFMFGLYFDIGSMLQSTMAKTEGTGSPGYTRAADQMERSSVKTEITVRDSSRDLPPPLPPARLDNSAVAARSAAIYARVSQVKPLPTGAELLDAKRKFMSSKGYPQDYIELEIRGLEDQLWTETSKRVDELIDKGQYEEAEKLLLEQIDGLDPRDLINLQRFRSKLQQVYLDTNELDKYRDAMRQMFDTEDKMLSLQSSTARLLEDKHAAEAVRLHRAELGRKRAEFDPWFEQMKSQLALTGSVHKLTDNQKSELKAGLLRAQEAGQISPDDLQKALKEIEEMEKKSATRPGR